MLRALSMKLGEIADKNIFEITDTDVVPELLRVGNSVVSRVQNSIPDGSEDDFLLVFAAKHKERLLHPKGHTVGWSRIRDNAGSSTANGSAVDVVFDRVLGLPCTAEDAFSLSEIAAGSHPPCCNPAVPP
ncbi:MAG: hypothetical protein ACKPKO_53625, partial [Candidatus Fonsibacter sp.]